MPAGRRHACGIPLKGHRRPGLCNRICKHHRRCLSGRRAVTAAIFTVGDEHMERRNRNSGLKLAVSKAAPVNGSF